MQLNWYTLMLTCNSITSALTAHEGFNAARMIQMVVNLAKESGVAGDSVCCDTNEAHACRHVHTSLNVCRAARRMHGIPVRLLLSRCVVFTLF